MIYSPKQTQKRCNLSKFELAMVKKLKKSPNTRWMTTSLLK
ncbi:MAG: hypothetical protein U9Q62_03215 [Campylobacterota bacterium]|nr:hypothetical protein [Campylobacterota bacterium]